MREIAARLADLSPSQRETLRAAWRDRQRGETERIPERAFDGGDFPVSYAQERLWFLDQLSPGQPFYNLVSARRLPFAVHRHALDAALTELVRRHGVLRTCYPVVDGEPVQRVAGPQAAACRFVDLAATPAGEHDAALERLATTEGQRPFDLASGPIWRATLAALGARESAFVFVIHHIAADAASLEILFRELGVLYGDASAGRAWSLDAPPVQYADFAAWQREYLKGERLDAQVRYWSAQLAGVRPLALPTDRPRPPVQTYRGGQLELSLAADRRRGLDALARESSATPFMLLLAAFFVLLHRYSGDDDLTVGVPIANRTRRELEPVIGFFANSLVMRGDLSGNPTFRQLLGRVREMAVQAYSHQDVPFSAVVAAVKPGQDLSRNPLFQVSFQLVSQSAPADATARDGAVAFERGSAIFDLVLNLWERGHEIRGVLEYNSDLFDRGTVERLVAHYSTLLASIVAQPDAPIGALPLLTSAEREALIDEGNQTAADIPACGLHALVDEQARLTPDAIAVEDDDATLSYAALVSRASRLASVIRDADPRAGAAVAVLLPACADLVVAEYAALRAGRAFVPIDPSTPARRLERMLDAADVQVVVTPPAMSGRVPPGRRVVHPSVAEDIEPVASVEVSASDLAYVIFTSGSTGDPKGVMVTHGGAVNYLSWCRRTYPIDSGVGAPLCSPPWSDMSITTLFLPLICGLRVVLLDQQEIVEALDTALRTGRTFSVVKLTPSHLEALRALSVGRAVPTGTRAFIVGGEALLGETLAPWREAAPDLVIYNEYGPTETVVGCSVHAVCAGDTSNGSVPIGTPIANTRLYVLDARGEPVPSGVPGELYIGGAGVARGYAGAPSLTAERFLPDPFEPGGRMYRTGDRVRRRADGTLEYFGRLDRQLKVRGHRIEPGDVESAIRRHAAVAEAVVTAREVGRGDRRLVGFIVLAPGVPAGAEAAVDRPAPASRDDVLLEVRDLLRRELPAYMIPSALTVVDAIPLTSAGKADLEALAASWSPDAPPRRTSAQPSTSLERLLSIVVREVLDLSAVGIDDDFFADLGAHSLLATRAIARVRDLLQADVPLRWMFEAPTIRTLAARIGQDATTGAESVRAADLVIEVLEMDDADVRQQLDAHAPADANDRGPAEATP
jgi:amino acid adenylation domain-containing protein